MIRLQVKATTFTLIVIVHRLSAVKYYQSGPSVDLAYLGNTISDRDDT